MARRNGTDRNGNNFDSATVNLVWNKGRLVPSYDPSTWRYDQCGQPIKYSDHGNTESEFGWEIDHILPVDKGGSDHISNLQPLQWANNRRKGSDYPWYC